MRKTLQGKKTYLLAAGAVLTAVGTAVDQQGGLDLSLFLAQLWEQKDLILIGGLGATIRAAIAKIGG